jgi:large subunit ribosomal protein L21
MFAVVTISGKQYNVAKGDVLLVDKLEGEAGDTLNFDHVLLTSDKGVTNIGTPVVSGSVVKAKIVAQEKGEKIEIRRYKQKVRHRRKIGFRPLYTKLEIIAVG